MPAYQTKTTTLFLTIFFLVVCSFAQATTVQVPEWFRLTARFDRVPQLKQTLELQADLQAVIGNLKNVDLRLIMPEGWQAEPETLNIPEVREGTTRKFSFQVTPGNYLTQGSIVIEASFIVPKSDLINHIRREMPENATQLAETISRWPGQTKRYADISFALTPEESFYPLSNDMWLNYDDRIIVQEGLRGPVYYEDPLITAYQAQTDVEMFNKLTGYIKTDPNLLKTMQESGIDIGRKRYDQLNGLYVLAVKAYQDNSLDIAGSFINQFETAIKSEEESAFENLRIAIGNLKALIYWGKGQRRLAEDAFKKTFYYNRKHPLQRYILRNLGLFMLAGKDSSTAAEMFRLSRSFKKGYSLLERESELIGKN